MVSLIFLTSIGQSATQSRSGAGPEVTVYNQGFGVVKELRHLNLKKGVQSISLSDVPSMIDPTSVGMRSITQPGSFDVLEQNYQYDLVNVAAILNKSVGSQVRLVRHFGGKLEVLEGTLLSSPSGIYGGGGGGGWIYNGMVVKLPDGRLILNPEGEVEVLSMPEGLIPIPSLMWNLNSRRPGDNLVELSYVANGMHWDASYVLTLDSVAGTAALQGWASVNNECGSTFKNATLKLLAGDIHQVQPQNVPMSSVAEDRAAASPSAMREEQLFEYHLYTLKRPATIKNKEIKQLSLLESARVPFKKRLIIDALQDYGVYYPSEESQVGGGNLKPQVRVEFINDNVAGLGIPMPAGKFRIYQRDASGSVQLLGEDSIQHTPKNEKVSLLVGNSFDIVADRKRLGFHAIGSNHDREEFQIEVRNRKATTEQVELLERHYGDWKVTKTSAPFTKADANTMHYLVTLKPNEVRKITYTVETKW